MDLVVPPDREFPVDRADPVGLVDREVLVVPVARVGPAVPVAREAPGVRVDLVAPVAVRRPARRRVPLVVRRPPLRSGSVPPGVVRWGSTSVRCR
ncbi:hypothetical protein [Amycolatopsis sp. 195334CR]|uniref:hypothetical protein n=1 Tax=Amycolatopsis sp. 195334CR TaxID=2814588 RepID=UPI001A9043DD|nr:hypothetical protein [Amycolatopsis sp. 195334CR]MBN6036362.1 hypothetical protein [Amycolatopsis sp. 195334CR]